MIKDMILTKYLRKALANLGLSENESILYLCILQNINCDAPFLMQESKLSRAAVYKLLKLLHDKDLIETKSGEIFTTYTATPLAKIGKKLSTKGRKLEFIGKKLQEINPDQDFQDHIEIIDFSNHQDYYLEIASKLKDFIWCVGSYKAGEVFNGEALEREFIKTRVKKGARADAIIFDDAHESKSLAQRDKLEKRETKIISHTYYPLEFTYLFGDTCAHFYKDQDEKVKVMKIESPTYARAKLLQFQRLWQSTTA